ncbi:retrotransposon unclassified [Hordeum vulgare]|nr:retrotransposon unclassified [Hordeum vulgare]
MPPSPPDSLLRGRRRRLPSAGSRPHPAPPAPVAAAPLSPNARALRHAVPPPLRAFRPPADLQLALAPPPVPPAHAPLMHHANIASYILFKLSIDSGTYSKWRQLFWYVLCKYRVEDHVLEEVDPLHADPTWRNDDITIILWVYGTISDELYDTIHSPDSTAFRLSEQLEIFFRDNAAGRAVHIGADFRATVQGDMPITQYCRRLQQLASAMADIGEPVSDRSLTLQLIRSVSRRFHVMATLLPMQQPFPSFLQARSRLLLEEISITERERATGATALALSHGGSSFGGGGPSALLLESFNCILC